MKLKEAPIGHKVQVGDTIKSVARFMNITHVWKVHRVSKKYAFVMLNDIAEGKFPREYNLMFQRYPKDKWNTTDYKVLIEDK